MPEPRRSRALLLAALCLPPLAAAWVQAPALAGWFRSDDFVHLYQAESKSTLEYLLTQHGGHLQVAKNAFVLVLWRLFRFDVAPQLGVVLVLHLANVMLLAALARSWTGKALPAAFAATLWGTMPVAQATLGWLSVSGQVLCTACVLWVLFDFARVRAGQAEPSAAAIARWWALALVAVTSFGIGLGLALALPLAAFLLLEPGAARRRVVRALAPLWIAVPALYLSLQWAAREIAGTGLRAFSWGRIVEEPALQLVLLARYLACGAANLLLAPWASSDGDFLVGGPWAGEPAESAMRLAWPAGAALAAALAAVAWRVPRARRTLGALALLALASYATIVAGRIPIVLDLDLPAGAMTLWPRYHYVGPAFLALAIGVACGAAPVSRVLARAGVAAGLAWLALCVPLDALATRRARTFVPEDGRREHAAVLAEIERAVERTPAGGTAWLPNLAFGSAHVVKDPFVRFPGWAAVFVLSYPGDGLRGRSVRFAERGAARLARLRELEPGSRAVGLLVPLDEVPEPPRAELARVLAANRARRSESDAGEEDDWRKENGGRAGRLLAPMGVLESGGGARTVAGEDDSEGREPAGASASLADLNPAQRAAVLHGEGPLLILAGPGSGKTRVITRRIAWLVLERGVYASRILAITFTNKAAREMRERVERLLPEGEAARAWIGTFHGTCARILRREIETLSPEEGGGFTRDFTIYDTHDRNQLIKELVKAGGWDHTRFRPAVVGGWISDWKSKVAAPREEAWEEDEESIEGEVFKRIRAAYREAMRKANALDFDDLLLVTLRLFERHLGVRDQYAERFLHVMVDEYQDTNRVQYLLARHFASRHGNLAVCGDPDQSIYAWRGADIRNILAFEEDFPEPAVVRLEQNYRSTGNVLAAAQAVIANNIARKPKDLWSEREAGERLAVIECGDENDEGAEIARQIQGLRAAGRPLSDVAIFYRANFMQRAIETQLRLAGVGYQIVGGVEFYQRREIRDLVCYLRLAVNPADDAALARVVNVPARGVGDTTMARLSSWATDRRLPLSAALRSKEAMAQVRGRAKGGLAGFALLLDELKDLRERPAAEALERVIALTGYEGWLAQSAEDEDGGVDRQANVDELRTHAETYDALNPEGKLAGFLQDVALVSDVDSLEEDAGGKVTLMTLHSAKGLEFGVVILAGCEEELLPHARALAEGAGGWSDGLEEERRLFYVGMTRAKDRLLFTWARRRLHFGQELFRQPSRFLEELPQQLVEGLEEDDEETALGRFEPVPDAPGADLAVGDRVEHDHFGRGTVLALVGRGANARATVEFREHGTKQLLLQYAKLVKLGGAR